MPDENDDRDKLAEALDALSLGHVNTQNDSPGGDDAAHELAHVPLDIDAAGSEVAPATDEDAGVPESCQAALTDEVSRPVRLSAPLLIEAGTGSIIGKNVRPPPPGFRPKQIVPSKA